MNTGRILIIAVLGVLLGGIDLQADNSFFRVLAAKPNATMEDGVKMLYMLTTGESSTGKMTFQEICDILSRKGIIRKSYTKNKDRLLNRGQVSYMLCKALGIKGGLTMRIFGVSERYGFRECVYLKLVPPGTQWDRVTGGELLGIMARAADYQEKNKHRKSSDGRNR